MNAPKAKQTVTPWHINRCIQIMRAPHDILEMVAASPDADSAELCKLELERRTALEA